MWPVPAGWVFRNPPGVPPKKKWLDWTDAGTDTRLDFAPGTKDEESLAKKVRKGKAAVAFVMYPVQMDELMAVSDAGKIMPPKSTWFEPKLMSGLVTYKF